MAGNYVYGVGYSFDAGSVGTPGPCGLHADIVLERPQFQISTRRPVVWQAFRCLFRTV
jgi:hypothetical protein